MCLPHDFGGRIAAKGIVLSAAVRWANAAVGLEVERLGGALVSRAEIEAELARFPRLPAHRTRTPRRPPKDIAPRRKARTTCRSSMA